MERPADPASTRKAVRRLLQMMYDETVRRDLAHGVVLRHHDRTSFAEPPLVNLEENYFDTTELLTAYYGRPKMKMVDLYERLFEAARLMCWNVSNYKRAVEFIRTTAGTIPLATRRDNLTAHRLCQLFGLTVLLGATVRRNGSTLIIRSSAGQINLSRRRIEIEGQRYYRFKTPLPFNPIEAITSPIGRTKRASVRLSSLYRHLRHTLPEAAWEATVVCCVLSRDDLDFEREATAIFDFSRTRRMSGPEPDHAASILTEISSAGPVQWRDIRQRLEKLLTPEQVEEIFSFRSPRTNEVRQYRIATLHKILHQEIDSSQELDYFRHITSIR